MWCDKKNLIHSYPMDAFETAHQPLYQWVFLSMHHRFNKDGFELECIFLIQDYSQDFSVAILHGTAWSLYPCSSEAPCSHVAELAKAHVRSHPEPSREMYDLANVRLDDAERGVHRVFKKYKLVPNNVPIEYANLGPGLSKFPYIRPSSWVKHLLDSQRLPQQLVGVPTFSKMRLVLTEFWKRFRVIRPSYHLFQLADAGAVSLESCVPIFSHTDEGRSYKHLGLWVVSFHGCLGRGTRPYLATSKHKLPLSQNEMGLNFIGKTWSSQFIFSTMIKTTYNKHPTAQDQLLKIFAGDMENLLVDGVCSRDGQHQVHLVHIGTKGDLPALTKLGQFQRSFSHVPRGGTSKKPCGGVCHLCMAGVEAGPDHPNSIPFEDMSPQADWVATMYAQVPWQRTPTILKGLSLSEPESMEFFVTDLWHNFHLGVSKHFVGSSFAAIIQSDLPGLPAGSVEVKFAWLTRLYLAFFQGLGRNPFITEISRETMGFPMSTTCPIGKWSKGQASTELMMFLNHFCKQHVVNKTQNRLLLSIVSWVSLAQFVSQLFTCCLAMFSHACQNSFC